MRHLLSQQPHSMIGKRRSVKRVAPHERLRGGMGWNTLEGDGQVPSADPDVAADVIGEGVDHYRGIDMIKNTSSDQIFFARVPFLCRGAHEDESSRYPGLTQRGGGAEKATYATGGDYVVPAGMADAGERIVFTQDRDRRMLIGLEICGSELRIQRRLYASGTTHDCHPVLF